MANHHLLVFALIFSLLVYSSYSYQFVLEWVAKPSENYNQWAGRMRFSVNDTIQFKYKGGADSVAVVRKDGYDKCDAANPIVRFDDGDSIFKFDRSGPFYFITANKANCDQGQKLIVVVLAIRTPPSPPSPPSPGVNGHSPSAAPPLGSSPGPSPAGGAISPGPATGSSPGPSPAGGAVSPGPATGSSPGPSPAGGAVSPGPATSSLSPSPSSGATPPGSTSPAEAPGDASSDSPSSATPGSPDSSTPGAGAVAPGSSTPGSGTPADVNSPPAGARSMAAPPCSGRVYLISAASLVVSVGLSAFVYEI